MEEAANDLEDALAGRPFDPGTAGASAQRVYEHRVAAREARVKDRFGNRLGRVVLAVAGDPQSTRAWATGAIGEHKLAESLAQVPGIAVLNDRAVPGSRRNIDCIVVAPAGVFVIDAKRYDGEVHFRDRGWLFRPDWRLYVGRRDCSRMADAMNWQVEAVKSALAALEDPEIPITPVLCFVDAAWPLIHPPEEFRGVRIEGLKSIRKLVVKAEVLSLSEVDHLARQLALALPSR